MAVEVGVATVVAAEVGRMADSVRGDPAKAADPADRAAPADHAPSIAAFAAADPADQADRAAAEEGIAGAAGAIDRPVKSWRRTQLN